MARIKIPIKTETIKIVKIRCPLESRTLGVWRDFNYTKCLECLYFLSGEGDGHCGWLEYVTGIVSEKVEIDNDPFGADTPNDYTRVIKCANCGSEITFYSTYSSFVLGDQRKCPKCNLLHTFLRSEKTKKGYVEVFAIPIKE